MTTTTGVVLVEPRRCIGCAMCAVVCPFDVVTFHPLAGGPGRRDRGGREVRRVRRAAPPGRGARLCSRCARSTRSSSASSTNWWPPAGCARPARCWPPPEPAPPRPRRRSPGRLARLGCRPAGRGRRATAGTYDRNREATTGGGATTSGKDPSKGGPRMSGTNGNGRARRLTINKDAQAMIDVARRRGHRDGVGPARGPAAPVRVLRTRAELPQLRHGAVPHRPVRRGSPEGRVRGRRRRHRGPQPGSDHRRRLVVALRPRPGHPRDVRGDGPGRDHRLPRSPTRTSCAGWPTRWA